MNTEETQKEVETSSYQVVFRRGASMLTGTPADRVRRARAEGRLQRYVGWDEASGTGGLIGAAARTFGPDLVSVAEAPADLLWLAELVFDRGDDEDFAERFWDGAQGVRTGAAWRVAGAALGRWGNTEGLLLAGQECREAGEGIRVPDEGMGGVEEVVGCPVPGWETAPMRLVRHVTAMRFVSLDEVGRVILDELKLKT